MISRADYDRAFARVQELIRAGDIYQANLTFLCRTDLPGDPLSHYAALRGRGAGGYSALIRHDGRHLLSFSPERFFVLEKGRIRARPMKGTAPRGSSAAQDAALARNLAD